MKIPILKSLTHPIASIYIVISPKTLIKYEPFLNHTDNLNAVENREAEYEQFKQRASIGAWSW